MQGPEQLLLTGRIHPISLEVRPLQLENTLARNLGLRDGQIIQATLEMRGDSLKLLINGGLVDLPPGFRLRAGDTVLLRAQARPGSWLLRPVDARSAAAAGAAEMSATEAPGSPVSPQSARPQGMPAPVHLTSSRLQALLLRPPLTPELMSLLEPRELAALLKHVGKDELVALFRRLQLSIRGLSPELLQSSVIASGLWLEALLGSGRLGATPDVKTLLRRMLRALGDRDLPDQTRIARAIDDIESAQVESVKAQTRGELLFPLVLPFVDANPVELRFSRARRRGSQEDPSFTVDLHTQHATLGEIWLQIAVSDRSQVHLMLWATTTQTATAARKQAELLRQRLAGAGLSFGTMRVFNSARPVELHQNAPPGTMLDIQT
ncbi:MAG: hypothetical protein RI937_1366 [Pseudomonadota bacterium]|jgi:hypothetical protein